MFKRHLLYLTKCTLLFTPPPLPPSERLYDCKIVDNCERPLSIKIIPFVELFYIMCDL